MSNGGRRSRRGVHPSQRSLAELHLRVLRLLICLFPAEFRLRYGAEMEVLLCERSREELAGEGLLRRGVWTAREAADLILAALGSRLRVRGAVAPGLAAAAVLALLWITGRAPTTPPPGIAGPASPPAEMVVRAVDPAGEFSLTLRAGRLVAATVNRTPVPAERLLQEGDSIRIMAEDGTPIVAVQFELPGSIRWQARRPSAL